MLRELFIGVYVDGSIRLSKTISSVYHDADSAEEDARVAANLLGQDVCIVMREIVRTIEAD
jgi:hypothetical protein